MSWTAATDTGGAGIDHYEVWVDGSPDVLAGSPTATSFTDAAITTEATYAYYVVAVDKAGNSGPPTAVKSITYDITAPTVPAGLVASASPTGAKPALAFSAATDTGGTGVATYRLYRDGAFVATAAGTTVSDTALSVDGSYSYRVSAARRGGQRVSAVGRGARRLRQDGAAGGNRPERRGDAHERQAGADLDVGRRRCAVGLRALRHLPRRGAGRQLARRRRSPTPRCRRRAPTATP